MLGVIAVKQRPDVHVRPGGPRSIKPPLEVGMPNQRGEITKAADPKRTPKKTPKRTEQPYRRRAVQRDPRGGMDAEPGPDRRPLERLDERRITHANRDLIGAVGLLQLRQLRHCPVRLILGTLRHQKLVIGDGQPCLVPRLGLWAAKLVKELAP